MSKTIAAIQQSPQQSRYTVLFTGNGYA